MLLIDKARAAKISRLFNFKTLRLSQVLLILGLLIGAPAWAQSSQSPEPEDLLAIDSRPPAKGSQEASVAPEQLELLIPIDNPNLEQNDEAKKRALLRRLRDTMGQEPSNDKGLVIPVAPEKLDDLKDLEAMTSSEIENFLAKKEKFLTKFAAVPLKLGLKKSWINKALKEVNNKFYASSRLIAKSNSRGLNVMVSLSGGLALPQRFLAALKKTQFGRFIPERGGFFYLFGLGAGLSRTLGADGKNRLVFEIFLDVERLHHAVSGIVEMSLAGTYAIVYELREGPFAMQKNLTSYGGVSGVFREGKNQFGWALSTGLSLPPGIGAILLFRNETTRYYLMRVSTKEFSGPGFSSAKNDLRNFIAGFFERFFSRRAEILCAKLFGQLSN